MRAPRYSVVTATHLFPAFGVSETLYTKIHNYSYIQIKTNKSQVSHLKVQKPTHLEISRNEAKLTPLPSNVPQVHRLIVIGC